MSADDLTLRTKLESIYRVGTYRPGFAVAIVALSLVVAVLEGVGMGFILPIIQIAQQGTGNASGFEAAFLAAYRTLGIPFNLGYIILGVGAVIAVRYVLTFVTSWAGAVLQNEYVGDLRDDAFASALDARTAYFDAEGSDEILNAIITQTQNAGQTIRHLVRVLELGLISVAYVALALYLSPLLTVATAVVVGGVMVGFRRVLDSGYDVGERVAVANERVQQSVQAGMQGIRDVKLFNLQPELLRDFRDAIDQYVSASVHQERNQVAIQNVNQFLTAVSVFVLIYVGLELAHLSLGALGVFLFVMFRLGPKVSNLNNEVYALESKLPHLVRTQRFVARLENNEEPDGTRPLDAPIERVAFDDVTFAYEDEAVLRDLSFGAERGEFVAFVGPSGAGKSTIVSLLSRLYDPDSGGILVDGTPVDDLDVSDWRERIAVIRQDPFIFNDTLEHNLTIGNRDATRAEIDRVCDIAQIDEFLGDLPEGYDTVLGDQGVRLSGGQKQRVAIARGLLKDADVLVLDEATSDLDSQLEERVHRGIEDLDTDYITVAIAHRLSTIVNADRIYTVEDGRIVEQGNHADLLDEDGRYANLYSIQTSGVS